MNTIYEAAKYIDYTKEMSLVKNQGLFKYSMGLNTALISALNILRKVIGDEFLKKEILLNIGFVHNPTKNSIKS